MCGTSQLCVCIFLRTAGILNETLSTNIQPPQALRRLLLFPFALLAASLTLYHSPELALRQEARKDGMRERGRCVFVCVLDWGEVREIKRIGSTYKERRGAVGRNRAVSERLPSESVK